MGIINSDILIEGKHAQIISELNKNKLFDNNADCFVEAFFLGLYHGEKKEIDLLDSLEVQISRTYFQRRDELERMMFTYLQLEKTYQQEHLDVKDVYLIDQDTPNEVLKEMLDDIKGYALHGIELLGEKHKAVIGNVNELAALDSIIDNEILSSEKIRERVIEDEVNLFFKSFEDDEIDSILMS